MEVTRPSSSHHCAKVMRLGFTIYLWWGCDGAMLWKPIRKSFSWSHLLMREIIPAGSLYCLRGGGKHLLLFFSKDFFSFYATHLGWSGWVVDGFFHRPINTISTLRGRAHADCLRKANICFPKLKCHCYVAWKLQHRMCWFCLKQQYNNPCE